MPTFDGDPRRWRSFWERFSQWLAQFPSIPPTEKIAQLERAIHHADGKALIRKARGTQEDYESSIESLRQWYDRPRSIYKSYMHDAFTRVTPRTRKGYYDLNADIGDAMEALDLYGGTDSGSVMVAAYERGLAKESTSDWTAYLAKTKSQPTMKAFRAFLTEKAEELEEVVLPLKPVPVQPRPKQPTSPSSKYSASGNILQ